MSKRAKKTTTTVADTEPVEKVINQKARRWCFTWNNYTQESVDMVNDAVKSNRASFIMYGFEEGASGTKHLQGYAEFDSALAISTCKSRIDIKLGYKSPIHVEKAFGSFQENVQYCSKEGKVTTIGRAKSQGERKDWEELYCFVYANPDMALVAKEYPGKAIKYWNGIEKLVKIAQAQSKQEALANQYKDIILRPWQQDLMEILKTVPNTRTVHWYWDDKGNVGKSWFCKYVKYIYPQDCALLTSGRSTDVAHMYNCERIAIFDLPRSNEERINYGMIEQIKDGKVFSPKYDSHTKVCACPHVVCFANFLPERAALSQDRWHIVNIAEYKSTSTLEDNIQQYTDVL